MLRHPNRRSVPPTCPLRRYTEHISFVTVFVTEQGFSIDDEMDAYDAKAEGVHMLLNVLEEEEDGEVTKVPAGVVRIITSKNKVRPFLVLLSNTWGGVLTRMGHEQLGRLAILPPYRKYGFGRVLVQGVHDWARSQLKGPDEKVQVVLHSQVRPPFFSTSSFRRSDEELMDV
jgi:predicted GNAT family N-acyltransferase